MGDSMRRWRISRGMVLMASMLLEQACWFKKAPPKASIVIPPAPQAQAPKPMPMPPQLPAETTTQQTVTAEGLPTLPPPVEAPKPVKPRPARKTGQASNPESHTPPVAEPNENPASQPGLIPNPEPSLQPILGSREIQERTRRIQSYLEKARLSVLRAERSNPNAVQKDLIAQVRTFLQQAEDAKRVDLARAENLAERAEVLSRGLKR